MSDSTIAMGELRDIQTFARTIKQNISPELSQYIKDCLELAYHQGAREALHEYNTRVKRIVGV